MVREAGLDLPCGAGRLGLQGAPGALPSALGFKSPIIKNRQLTRWVSCLFWCARRDLNPHARSEH